jgi:hypothetical protein
LRRNDVARHAISRGLVAAGAIPGKDSDIHQALLAAPMAWLEIHSGECAKAAERLVVAISHFPHNAESWPIEAQLLALLAHSRSRAVKIGYWNPRMFQQVCRSNYWPRLWPNMPGTF